MPAVITRHGVEVTDGDEDELAVRVATTDPDGVESADCVADWFVVPVLTGDAEERALIVGLTVNVGVDRAEGLRVEFVEPDATERCEMEGACVPVILLRALLLALFEAAGA